MRRLAILLILGAASAAAPAHADTLPSQTPQPQGERTYSPAPDARVPAAYRPGPDRPDRALQARIAGTTFRAEIWDGFLLENHIHRFRPDGTVDGEFTARRLIRQGIDFVRSADRGRWTVADGRLCVTWRKFFLGKPQCYELTPVAPGRVRFTNLEGGPSFVAQFSRR